MGPTTSTESPMAWAKRERCGTNQNRRSATHSLPVFQTFPRQPHIWTVEDFDDETKTCRGRNHRQATEVKSICDRGLHDGKHIPFACLHWDPTNTFISMHTYHSSAPSCRKILSSGNYKGGKENE